MRELAVNSNVTNLRLIALLVASLIVGSLAQAAPLQEIALGIQRAKPAKETKWDFSADYGVSSNLNAPERPRAYDHSLGLSASREFLENYTGSVSWGVDYTTLDTDVYRDNPNDPYYRYGDIGLSVFRTLKTQDLKQSLSLSVSEDILVSEESRYLGYRSVTGASANHTWSVMKKLRIRNTLSGGYLLNRYKYSPVEMGSIGRGTIMADGYYSYAVGPTITLYKGLSLGATMSVRGTHYLDQSSTWGFGNSYSLTYGQGNWSAYVKYVNKGYADRGETNLWFVDHYRRLASLGVSYNF